LTTPRLRSFSVKGFRAYGAVEQALNLPSDLAVVWGPNSKGKTSLAEAFEFLLTGRIARREMMASTQDEFADALRNAHLAANEEVYVAARIIGPAGTEHEIKRVLTSDYAKRQDCTSRLEIDGVTALEGDLAKFGIALSQPPLQAPILAQHTLGYIFSVRPQDRATYFKTLFEVTDLDYLRNDIAGLAAELTVPHNPLHSKFDRCAGIPVLKPVLASMLHTIHKLETLTAKIEDAARTLIAASGEEVPKKVDARRAVIERILADRRSKSFPMREFDLKDITAWDLPSADVWTRLQNYLDERKKVDEDTQQLIALFYEALKIPAISGITEPVDCPLCGTESALTPDRVKLIRQHVENEKARDFKTAETAAKTVLTQLSASARVLATAAEAALPRYLKTTAAKRREIGFSVTRMRELLGDRAEGLITPWLVRIRPLAKARAALLSAALAASALVEKQTIEIETALEPEKLEAAFVPLATLRNTLSALIDAYKTQATALVTALNELLDAQSDTAGWQDFLDIAQKPETLREALIERQARAVVGKELEIALKEIDRAKEQVLDDKFSDYSDLIQEWWERLRPDEPTFFSAVQPRKGAKRTIDFKAGLSVNPDRSSAKLRDVIAVFSQSQLHCLGLALFLARAQHDGLPFIILDDPVLSSDEDYRVHFNSTVLTELVNLSIQVIVLTQDHGTWEELETRYRHSGISTAQLYIDTPAEGSIIENTSDALLAKINRAKSLARGGHPDVRKECGIQLRDAGERFCKEMLLKNCRDKGDTAACLTNYDGKTLEWLCPHVEPLLDHDPSHPGKLAAFRKTVNHACHDNAPPSNAEMTHACAEISFLVKNYLGR
jgi:hypothetical protein